MSLLKSSYDLLSHTELVEIINSKELAIQSRDNDYQQLKGHLEKTQNEYEVGMREIMSASHDHYKSFEIRWDTTNEFKHWTHP